MVSNIPIKNRYVLCFAITVAQIHYYYLYYSQKRLHPVDTMLPHSALYVNLNVKEHFEICAVHQ